MAQRFRFPGVDVQGAAVPPLPAGRGRQPPARLHRPHQPGREEGAWRTGPRTTRPTTSGTEYIGKLGLEQSYERELHGTTGFEEVETSAGGRAVRRLASHAADAGQQAACCRSTSGCRRWSRSCSASGAARWWRIDPRNGEVLAFVSKPTFDPNLFVDGIDAESWQRAQRVASTSRC
ncbi:MAG: hypothetical protein MZW92_14055 [Comamonadaceae bacterium]|nr:hypothetical protein [Comamonadaceae bacterium]